MTDHVTVDRLTGEDDGLAVVRLDGTVQGGLDQARHPDYRPYTGPHDHKRCR
ncbi:hypothetical protein [Saccharopolyspora dendranthemae]|uniref:hypothetical protein n=1 Tax=Saccharopolyspora dendranthemae TaxID=1181886 RepID=UPI0016486226|nr:hypothetical protein [Saccharopolyspora dendranthemae]